MRCLAFRKRLKVISNKKESPDTHNNLTKSGINELLTTNVPLTTRNKPERLFTVNVISSGDDSHADQYRYPYEPTPYCVLERLANSGWIRKGNTLLDYGCGKGRVDFFLSYIVPEEVDRIYFFNPFSIEILQKVIARVAASYYESQREIQLYFYYPSDEYMTYLMTVDELVFFDEIDCRDLFPGENQRERIVVFSFG